MRTLPALLLTATFLSAAILLAPLPATAGGAWPRGKGNVFASVSWTTFGDFAGYLEQISQPIVDGAPTQLEDEIGIYAEYGLTERLTFGLDRFDRPKSAIGASIWFLRRSLGDPDWTDKIAAEIGFGTVSDWRGLDDSMLRLGLAWGRSFESRWGDGWIDVDTKAGWQVEVEEAHWKLDTTLGLSPGEHNIVYVQLQSGGLDDAPAYLRAVPTYVRRIGHGFSIESAVQLGLVNDDAQGVKIGTWLEF